MNYYRKTVEKTHMYTDKNMVNKFQLFTISQIYKVFPSKDSLNKHNFLNILPFLFVSWLDWKIKYLQLKFFVLETVPFFFYQCIQIAAPTTAHNGDEKWELDKGGTKGGRLQFSVALCCAVFPVLNVAQHLVICLFKLRHPATVRFMTL